MDILGLNQAYRHALRRERLFRDRQNPFELYDDTELHRRYRFTRDGIHFLIENLNGLESPTARSFAIPKHVKVYVGLRCLAIGAFQTLVCDELGIQLYQPSISRCVTQFLESMQQFAPTCIQWPVNIMRSQQYFFEHFRIPEVVGCIDGTHVQIQAPIGDEEPAFVNRLNYHSINVQAVCDEKAKFISINANQPGSVHDSTVLRVSTAKSKRINA